eukprot:TRINITY_DN4818_c0_g1_i2.p2 TRINITY_DN4818_c0_g1~~TRINITY_DN4818_c0_g1_i2.p2  ORF type:complete len:184 (+),score=42.00 TRINITY_DN4818_c0_g1_i2:134-685(+)
MLLVGWETHHPIFRQNFDKTERRGGRLLMHPPHSHMTLAFLAVLLLCVPCAAVALETPLAPRLIFTEYMEAGDGINRAIEIANVGDATASFATSPHTLAVYSGGGALSSEIPIDTGSLAPGEVLVVTHPDAVDLLAQPKLHASHILASRSLLFDGDDAIALEDTARTPLDMIGIRSSSMRRTP